MVGALTPQGSHEPLADTLASPPQKGSGRGQVAPGGVRAPQLLPAKCEIRGPPS